MLFKFHFQCFNIVIFEYVICVKSGSRTNHVNFLCMFISFQSYFCEQETYGESSSWEEKIAEEFKNEQEDFSGRYTYGKEKHVNN